VAQEWVGIAELDAPASIAAAGSFYSFACPLAGNASYGKSWADTH